VLLTRLPLSGPLARVRPFDLHALGTPPAFILSQDQTLHTFQFELTTVTSRLNSCKASVLTEIQNVPVLLTFRLHLEYIESDFLYHSPVIKVLTLLVK
jgi:hypothetical protein